MPVERGTSAYVTRFDGVRVLAADYQPVWVASLSPGEQGRPRRDDRERGNAPARITALPRTFRLWNSWQAVLCKRLYGQL